MNIYWDLSEKDRANLTREDVEQYIDAELMTLGVLKVKPLVLEPVHASPQPTQRYFRIRYRHVFLDVAFERVEDAQAFLALDPKRVDASHYGEFRNFVVSGEETEIVSVAMFSKQEFDAVKDFLREADAAKASNNKKQQEYDEAVKKQHQVLNGLLGDWDECISKRDRLRRVIDTFHDYEKIAGDRIVAAKFLTKAFSQADIREAAHWFGVSIEIPADAFTVEKNDAPKVSGEENNVPF